MQGIFPWCPRTKTVACYINYCNAVGGFTIRYHGFLWKPLVSYDFFLLSRNYDLLFPPITRAKLSPNYWYRQMDHKVPIRSGIGLMIEVLFCFSRQATYAFPMYADSSWLLRWPIWTCQQQTLFAGLWRSELSNTQLSLDGIINGWVSANKHIREATIILTKVALKYFIHRKDLQWHIPCIQVAVRRNRFVTGPILAVYDMLISINGTWYQLVSHRQYKCWHQVISNHSSL